MYKRAELDQRSTKNTKGVKYLKGFKKEGLLKKNVLFWGQDCNADSITSTTENIEFYVLLQNQNVWEKWGTTALVHV